MRVLHLIGGAFRRRESRRVYSTVFFGKGTGAGLIIIVHIRNCANAL